MITNKPGSGNRWSVSLAERGVFGQDAELKGQLKLTVAHDVANRLLSPKIVKFRSAYPCIDLVILTTAGLVDLAAREADIVVRLTAKPPDYLVGREVLPLRHGVYGASQYLQSQDGAADVILFRGNTDMPPWVTENYPNARVRVCREFLFGIIQQQRALVLGERSRYFG